ncbi:MAG: FAD-dependent oxidoreductase [candidate division WS1 bacterium]|nr:FAD-dependent oxidoreductase [candidate division WS1 bacterium]
MSEGDKNCDLLIIGAGPAGCTAALYGARAGLTTIMLSPGETTGMMAKAPLVANFPAQPPAPGRQILARIREQALAAGAEHALEAATFVDFSGEDLLVAAGNSLYHAAAVIVATGAMAPAQPVPGEQEFQGRGVGYCVACDGPLFANKDVLVVGEDEQAAEEALALSGLCRAVTLVTPTPRLVFAEDLQQALNGRENVIIETGLRLQEIVGNQAVTGATFRDRDGAERVLEADGVFLYLRGRAPAIGFLQGTLETDESGYVLTNELCQTSHPRVFAAGDVRAKEVRQNITAAAEGCIAALAAERMIRRTEKIRYDRGGGK